LVLKGNNLTDKIFAVLGQLFYLLTWVMLMKLGRMMDLLTRCYFEDTDITDPSRLVKLIISLL